jgi:hypothetical protein
MVLGLCCLLTACGTNKPSTQDLIDALQSSLPGYIKIEGVSIDATEDVGGEVDAKVRMRFKGKASLIEPLYVSSGGNIHVSGGSMRVLEESAPSGQHLEFYGIAQATYKLDQWQIDFEEREFTPTLRGRPLPFYTPAESYVVKGSKEETALLAKKEQEDAVRLKEQKEQANNLIQMFKDNNLLEGVVRRIPHGDMPFELRISSFGGLDSAKVFEGTLVWKESREDMNKTAAVYCVYEDGHVYIVEPNTAAAGEPPEEFVYGLTSFDNGVIRGSWMLNPPTKSQALYQPGRLIFIRAPR